MMKLMMFLLVALLLAGCGDKKIDTSTDEAMKQSLQEVSNSLSEAKQVGFEDAVEVVILSGIGNFFTTAANPDGVERCFKGKQHCDFVQPSNLQ